MVRAVASMILLAGQLNPALMPQKAPKPSLPRIDLNACPFEGCQFGKWTARESTRVLSTWKSGRNLIRTLAQGETVTALTGIYITREPSEIKVTAPIPEYGLKPGDTVFGYRNLGEGVFNAWFNGTWVEDFDGSGVRGGGCSRNCTMKLVKPGRVEWWVKLRTRDGNIGWTKEADRFDGKDALGGP